jgi:hypothetical protein
MDSLADFSGLANIPGLTGNGGEMGMARSDMGLVAPMMDAAGNPVASTKPLRGFVLTLKMSTPSASGVVLIDKFNATLRASLATPERPLEVQATHIAHQMVVRDDKQRLAEIGAAYVAAQEEKRKNAQPAMGGPGGGGIGGGMGGGMMPPPPGGAFAPDARGGAYGGGAYGGGAYGGQPYGGPGAGLPPGIVNQQGNPIPDEAYLDPVLQEDIRGDTECTVVLIVVLDPPPKAKSNKTLAMAQPAGN